MVVASDLTNPSSGGNVTDLDQIDRIREDFPMLKQLHNGRPQIYFDSACTTLVSIQVIEAMNECYYGFPTCAGDRSSFWLSDIITRKIEGKTGSGTQGARQKLQTFINTRSSKEIVFTANTSHAINIVALGFPFTPGDRVLITDKEHNSNLLPWLHLQKKGLIEVVRVNTNNHGAFDMHEFKHQLENGRIRLVSMGYTSNLTGDSIPARKVIQLAHQYGAMLESALLGGGTVSDATYTSYSLLDQPERFEVGVQNYPGQIAAGTAVD